MAGRSRQPGSELRTERTAVRWTPSELGILQQVQKDLGIRYLTDIPRDMTLKQLRIRRLLGDESEDSTSVDELIAMAEKQAEVKAAARRAGLSLDEIVPLASEQARLRKEAEDAGLEAMHNLVPLAKKQTDLERALHDRRDDLRKMGIALGADSLEEVVATLALRQLDLISSALKRDVAE